MFLKVATILNKEEYINSDKIFSFCGNNDGTYFGTAEGYLFQSLTPIEDVLAQLNPICDDYLAVEHNI